MRLRSSRAGWASAASLVAFTAVVAVACGGGSATPTATPRGTAASARDVRFIADGDSVYGTLQLPAMRPGAKVPAALILAGSGPTDRNGNSKLLAGKTDTLKAFAQALAADGVASLRYDKLGTGETGLGSYASHPNDIGFDVYVDEAIAAYRFLAARPEVDAQRMLILGHSEGALIAMVAADRLGSGGPVALVLAAPPGHGYLETIQAQITAQFQAALARGQVSKSRADAAVATLTRIVESLKTSGTYPPGVPIDDPALKQIFTPATERFLAQVEKYDPAKEAAQLPAAMPILILHGDKDQQISAGDISALVQALRTSGHQHVDVSTLPNADHVFKDVPGTPNPASDYTNASLPFSPDAIAALRRFVRTALKLSG